jgi:two-component system sensor histidine kinase VicK
LKLKHSIGLLKDKPTDKNHKCVYQRVFELSAACLLMKIEDQKIKVAAVSNKYLELTSTLSEQLLGKDPFEVFPDTEDDPNGARATRKAIFEVVRTGEQVKIADYLYYITDPQTGQLKPFWWTSTFDPIFDEDGNVEYVLGTAIDNTSEHISKHDLIEAQQMLQLAITAGEIGTWSINAESQEIISSEHSKKLFGFKEYEHATLESMLEAIHPHFRKRVADMINEAFRSNGSANYHVEYPLIGIGDEKERWIRTTAKLFFNIGDNAKLLCGTLIDITEAKMVERNKTDFISMVSHDLKTPLSSVMGYMDLAIKDLKQKGSLFAMDCLSKARKQATKMNNLITGFLDVSIIENGKLNINSERFIIHELIEEMVKEALPYSVDHQIHIHPGPNIEVIADRNKIGQVITNLLSNAIKYSGKGTNIHISYEARENTITVHVIDDGVGIPIKEHAKLFNRFYRVEQGKFSSQSGYGIGLYMAAEIVSIHNGKIGLKSEEGKGSDFYFTLPI